MFARGGCPVGHPLDCGAGWSFGAECLWVAPIDNTLRVFWRPSDRTYASEMAVGTSTYLIEMAILTLSGRQ